MGGRKNKENLKCAGTKFFLPIFPQIIHFWLILDFPYIVHLTKLSEKKQGNIKIKNFEIKQALLQKFEKCPQHFFGALLKHD